MRHCWRMRRHVDVSSPEQDIVWHEDPQRERQLAESAARRLKSALGLLGLGLLMRGFNGGLVVMIRGGAGCMRGNGAGAARDWTPRE